MRTSKTAILNESIDTGADDNVLYEFADLCATCSGVACRDCVYELQKYTTFERAQMIRAHAALQAHKLQPHIEAERKYERLVTVGAYTFTGFIIMCLFFTCAL